MTFSRAARLGHISKIRIGISHINPRIRKPNKLGISLSNAYAYVLFGSLKDEAQNFAETTLCN